MSRHKKHESIEEDAPKLDISSLIDATFLLLIYFLVTTTIQPREGDVPMQLPAAAPREKPPEIEPKLISITASGAISVGAPGAQLPMDADDSRNVPLLFADLQAYAAAAKSAGTDPLVQIYVESEARQQRVIDVLNALAGVGISKVTFTDLIDPD